MQYLLTLRRRRSGWTKITQETIWARCAMPVKIVSFISSYTPLYLIFALRFKTFIWLWWGLFTGSIILTILVVGLAVLKRESQQYPISKVEEGGANVAAYVASYLLPFVTVSAPSLRDLIGYIIFILVVGVIYVRTSPVGVHPLVYLTPWNIYQATTRSGRIMYIISREPPKSDTTVTCAPILSGLAINTKKVASNGKRNL